MKAMARRVKVMRGHPTVTEKSPEYDPQPNGLAQIHWAGGGGMCQAEIQS